MQYIKPKQLWLILILILIIDGLFMYGFFNVNTEFAGTWSPFMFAMCFVFSGLAILILTNLLKDHLNSNLSFYLPTDILAMELFIH